MLFRSRLSSLKHSALVTMITATVFLAGTALPDFAAMAEEAQQSAAPAEGASVDAPALRTMDQLVELVGPIALYPDELLAITLPAATYPLDIVQAARYLEKHKSNPDLKPDEKWDSSVLGLLNYPEVVDLMNKDLDWTWELGAAVADQQSDVMDAIQQFRNQAHTAGNLESNEKQIIIVEKEVIKIESATPEVIYVPTYKPSTVVVVQSTPYPYYYSAPYPYYYNPHAAFWTGMFVGAAISYGVGWGRYGRYGNNDINVSRGGNTVNIGSGNAGGGNRPGAGNRPGGGNRPGAGGGNRPGAGGGNRPGGGNKPGAGGGGNRPSAGTRPSTGQKPGSGSRPSAGTKPSTRPSTGSKPSTGQRPSSSNRGSFSGQGKSGASASRNSQRGSSSRSSQSKSRSSSSRGGGGRSSSSRAGGGRSGGGGRRR